MMIICSSCKTELLNGEAASEDDKVPCPNCGSINRTYLVEITGTITPTGKIEMRGSSITSQLSICLNTLVIPYGKTSDGDLIKLVDPFYSQLIELINRDAQMIYRIPPRKWEEIIAATYDKAGFDEVILTPRSADLGRDVIAIKHGFGAVKFIEQVKVYHPEHIVKADEVRALLGVLQAEQNASKAIFTTTSTFAPRLTDDRLIKQYIPYRLELVDGEKLLERLEDKGS
jgi:restriction system protein